MPDTGAADLLAPLSSIRPAADLPQVERIDAESIPEPARALLAHHRDMTPTLAGFHGVDMRLRVLARHPGADHLVREIVLLRADDARPVEYGAIHIHLDRFSPAARAEIEAGAKPFGAVLADHGVPHGGCPHAYLKVRTNPWLERCLELPAGPHVLYGRRNVLRGPDGAALADVLEILPPFPMESHSV